RRAGAGVALPIDCGFPVLNRPPLHNRGHRTIGNRSEPVSARLEPSPSGSTRILKIAAPRRSLEFRPQKPGNLHLGDRAPALAVETVSIEQQPLVAMRLALQRLRSASGAQAQAPADWTPIYSNAAVGLR